MPSVWHGWLGGITAVLLITAAALPVAVLVARWRPAAEVAMVYGTLPWVAMIMLPGDRAGVIDGRLSLVPVRDLVEVVAAGPATAVVQVLGNLLVFAALGFFGPIRFAGLASVWRVLALAAGCSVLVETLQYVLRLDRVSSADDVLLNAAGAALAALASRPWWRTTPAGASRAAAG